MTFVLAQPQDGVSARRSLPADRKRDTGLMALTQDQFFWKTICYFLGSTGIPVNFGITIALGFIVGAAITGQTFYLFTIENLKQFGALKAMGVSNLRIIGMILLQAVVVGLVGYGIGIGLTAAFFESTSGITHLAGLSMTPLAFGGVGVAVMADHRAHQPAQHPQSAGAGTGRGVSEVKTCGQASSLPNSTRSTTNLTRQMPSHFPMLPPSPLPPSPAAI